MMRKKSVGKERKSLIDGTFLESRWFKMVDENPFSVLARTLDIAMDIN